MIIFSFFSPPPLLLLFLGKIGERCQPPSREKAKGEKAGNGEWVVVVGSGLP